ncbi:hypothetical protein RIVM261_019550 [Rivularia sp. IAM M-261]|nr:hypothetical protein CAL7716_027750 [Calothrix sp. PCC 7716]GJD16999.1 hypothetical protein RIVM261_019550 [Rivularia sp. IAM M-261]
MSYTCVINIKKSSVDKEKLRSLIDNKLTFSIINFSFAFFAPLRFVKKITAKNAKGAKKWQ